MLLGRHTTVQSEGKTELQMQPILYAGIYDPKVRLQQREDGSMSLTSDLQIVAASNMEPARQRQRRSASGVGGGDGGERSSADTSGASSRRRIAASLAAARADELASRSAPSASREGLACVRDAKDAFDQADWEPALQEPWKFRQELAMRPATGAKQEDGTASDRPASLDLKVHATSALDVECRDITARELMQLIPEILASIPGTDSGPQESGVADASGGEEAGDDVGMDVSVDVRIPLVRLQLQSIGLGSSRGVPLVTVDLAALAAQLTMDGSTGVTQLSVSLHGLDVHDVLHADKDPYRLLLTCHPDAGSLKYRMDAGQCGNQPPIPPASRAKYLGTAQEPLQAAGLEVHRVLEAWEQQVHSADRGDDASSTRPSEAVVQLGLKLSPETGTGPACTDVKADLGCLHVEWNAQTILELLAFSYHCMPSASEPAVEAGAQLEDATSSAEAGSQAADQESGDAATSAPAQAGPAEKGKPESAVQDESSFELVDVASDTPEGLRCIDVGAGSGGAGGGAASGASAQQRTMAVAVTM